MYLTEPRLDLKTFAREKQDYLQDIKAATKHLRSVVTEKMHDNYFTPRDWRFGMADMDAIKAMPASLACDILTQWLTPRTGLELIIVGDYDETEFEDLLLKYIGSIPDSIILRIIDEDGNELAGGKACAGEEEDKAEKVDILAEIRDGHMKTNPYMIGNSKVVFTHLPDSEESASVYLKFPGANGWGHTTHPMFEAGRAAREEAFKEWRGDRLGVVVDMLETVIDNRLFKEVREKEGLVYSIDCSFDMYDFRADGAFTVWLTPFPEKIAETVELTLATLRDIAGQTITQKEFDEVHTPAVEAQRTAVNSSNSFWMNSLDQMQMTHIKNSTDVTHLGGTVEMSDGVTLADVAKVVEHYFVLDVVCVSVGFAGPEPPKDIDSQLDRIRKALKLT
eukprot:TRINITY_DN14588_c0_g1_i1.p1 TRINITY_DN14588_c0_g1~~TRINITY_DN14588_c0_g1_i1.p1  ORF type:complete len:392 (+),score=77.35 TRINITY_DN14588_c0_g1_i1:3-1178(+)